MASIEAMYLKVPLHGDTERSNTFRVFKVGVALLGGSCFVLLSVMAASAYGPAFQGTSAAESATSLFGLTSSLRTQTRAYQLPGSGPWKDLALAGIQGANRCGISYANPVKSVLGGMDSQNKAAVARMSTAVKAGAGDALKGVGAVAPLGFWDPLGFSTDNNEGRVLFFREVELKHGRICMLASLGILVAETFHPLFPEAGDLPAYIQFQNTPLQTFWIAVAAAIAIPEVLFSIPSFQDLTKPNNPVAFEMKLDRVPGDLGFDPLGLKPSNEGEFVELQNKEINNGRLAMIATAGIIAQELATGQKLFT